MKECIEEGTIQAYLDGELSLERAEKVVAHAARDHGVTEITPELAAKVRAAIKTE